MGTVIEAREGLRGPLSSAGVTHPDRVSMSAFSCLSSFPLQGEIDLPRPTGLCREELGVNC